MKKLLCLLLAVILVLGISPGTTVFAETEESTGQQPNAASEDHAETQPEEPSELPLLMAAENGSDFQLNESFALKAGSKIKLWERLDGGNADPANVGEYFDGQSIAYDGWQLMKLEITIPDQEGLTVTAVTPQTESLQPAYSQLTKTDSGYTYSYYFKQNGTYAFDIAYTYNGTEGHKHTEYTVSDLIYIPDITMRAFFIISMDPNEAHGYVTKSDITEGRYYYQDGTWTSGHPINPRSGGPGGFFSYVKDLESIQYMQTMSQLELYPNGYFLKNTLSLESLEPLTRGYYPNMKYFYLTSLYSNDTAVRPDAYTSEMLAEILTKMPNLDSFSANRTGFHNFEAFAKMNGKMQFVDCSYNNITSLEGLEKHTGLTILSLNRNNITDLTPLANVEKANTWNFIQNNVSDLRPIHNVALSGYGQGFHFGFQTVLPDPVFAKLQGDRYRLELPMPIDIDGTSTEIGFANWLAPQIGSQVPEAQREQLLVRYADGTQKLYPITEQDGKVFAEIPAADVPDGGTDSAFKNARMRYWFHNDNGKDSRTKGIFNGKVDFSATPVKPSTCTVVIRVVDKADSQTPVADAGFKLQCWKNGQWNDTALQGETDKNGSISFGPLSAGKYKLVQTSAPKGYQFDNQSYGPFTPDPSLNSIGTNGEFEVTDGTQKSFGTVVTNGIPVHYTVSFAFTAQNDAQALPKEVMDQLPASQTVTEGETVTVPADFVWQEVITSQGIWSFTGWDQTEVQNIASDVCFTGIWKFTTEDALLNSAPVITAADREITEGDTFDVLHGVTAQDVEDGDLTSQLEVIKNQVDSGTPGVYEVTYQVTDKAGICTVKTIKVTVTEKVPDVPETPTTPQEPEKPEEPTTPDIPPVTPQTGDRSNPLLWIILGLLALAGLIVPLFFHKKGKYQK